MHSYYYVGCNSSGTPEVNDKVDETQGVHIMKCKFFKPFKSLMHILVRKKFNILIIFFILFIVITPPSAITYYSNYLITKKIEENNSNFLFSSSSMLDYLFASINEKSSLLVSSNTEDFYCLLNAEDKSSPKAVSASYRLTQAVYDFLPSKEIACEMFVYFSKPDLVISGNGTSGFDFYINKHRIFENYSPDYFTKLMDTNYTIKILPITGIYTQTAAATAGAESFYKEVIPIIINPINSTKCDSVIVIFLDLKALNNYLGTLNTAKCSFLYILDSQNNYILNNPSDTDYAELLNLTRRKYTGTSGEFNLYADSHYNVSYQKSTVNRLTYICVTPRLLITRQLHSFLIITITIVIIASFLFLFIAYTLEYGINKYTTDIAYRIRYVMSPNNVQKHPVPSNSIQSLKKEVENICRQYELNQPHLIRSFLYKLLQYNVSDEEINKFSANFGIFRHSDYDQLFVIRNNFNMGGKSSSQDEQTTFVSAFCDTLSKYGYVVASNDKSHCIILLSHADKVILQQNASTFTAFYENYLSSGFKPHELKCAGSPVFQDIKNMYRYYHQMLNVLEFHGIREQKNIYTLEDMLSTSDDSSFVEHKRIILSTIKRNSYNDCTAYVNQILKEFIAQDISFSQYRQNILDLLFLMQEIMYDNAIAIPDIFESDETEFLINVNKIITVPSLMDLCNQLYHKLAQHLAQAVSPMCDIDSALLKYIDEHLAEINLTILADEIGMNQNYLSQYFKKHFGITFLEYVTRKKIEQAKELLLNTRTTCKAIGETLGFNDPNVFIRTFKKIEAMTPNEYRRSHRIHPELTK